MAGSNARKARELAAARADVARIEAEIALVLADLTRLETGEQDEGK